MSRMDGGGVTASIIGIGVWLPEEVRSNDAWPDDFGGKAKQGYDRTFNDIPCSADAAALTAHHLAAERLDPFLGSRLRRVAPSQMTSEAAEAAAAEQALLDAGIRASDLDCVLSYSTVPDQISPGAAGAVAHAIGAGDVMTWAMDAACASTVVQLATAVALVESGVVKNALLTQSHLVTRAMPPLHPALPGLGDAATAFVVSRQQRWPVLATRAVTSGQYHRAVTWVRADEPEQRWWLGGGNYRLGSKDLKKARRLMRDTVSFGGQTVKETCERARIDPERIALLASVQPRGWIPGAIAQHVGLANDVAVTTYDQYAHIGACGPITNWRHARECGFSEGVVALYAQGAGFTRAAALVSVPPGS